MSHPQQQLPALPVTVQATAAHGLCFQANKYAFRGVSGGVAPTKQLSSASSTTKQQQNVLSTPASLAAPGGGITLGTHTVAWSKKKSKSLVSIKEENKEQAYSAACRATLAITRINSAPGELTQGGVRSGLATDGSKFKYRKVIGGKILKGVSMPVAQEPSPQVVLDRLIQARGYSTQNFCSLEGAYYCKPTELQQASYGVKTVQVVRQSDEDALTQMLDCGLSPNPCNPFGESIVHMVCRRGDTKMLKVLIDKGCSLQVTDDFGRTPLHDACWTAEPNFEIVQLILDTDERLLHMLDCRGSSPLSYIKKDHWPLWIEFFHSKIDKYWSPRDVSKEGEEPPPKLVGEPPHSRPIPDPQGAASIEMATLIASGNIELEEVLRQKKTTMDISSTVKSEAPAQTV